MGKQNFARIYCDIREELQVASNATCTIKVSNFCSKYDPSKNYAGFIVYHHGGMCRWHNNSGVALGYNCRSFYVLISCTDNWTADTFSRAGRGYIHDKIYKDMFDGNFQDRVTCCGGFAILQGATRYSSRWLNDQSSRDQYSRWSWETDGSHILSRDEKAIVNEAIKTWKGRGPNSLTKVPRSVDQRLRRWEHEILHR